ncbi:MAG: MerR family transcriptional regulator [Ornithinibacter sp.]
MDEVELHSVGDVAARVGVTPSTVRMWGQRYGLNASGRSAGGHRRFTPADVDVLERFHQAVVSGESPMAAAAALTGSRTSGASGGGPGGAVLAVPGAGRQARGLARAASRLDEMAVEDGVLESLREQGTVAVWDEVVRPLLVAAGERWQRTGTGIEIEHLLTQAISTAFIRYLSHLPELPRDRPVLLAGGPHEEHILALYAVRARLAEEGVPSRLLGPRTPMHALASAAQRTKSPGVLVWMSIEDAVAERDLPLVRNAHRRLKLFVGGAGWTHSPHGNVVVTGSLDDAGAQLGSAWRARPHPGAV